MNIQDELHLKMTKDKFIEKWIKWVSYSERGNLAIEMRSDLEEIEKELSEDNWIKIESEDDLPKEDGMYKLGFFESSDKFYQDSNLCSLKTALCALKESHYTHYRQIPEFKPPIS